MCADIEDGGSGVCFDLVLWLQCVGILKGNKWGKYCELQERDVSLGYEREVKRSWMLGRTGRVLFLYLQVPFTEAGNGRGMLDFRSGGGD